MSLSHNVSRKTQIEIGPGWGWERFSVAASTVHVRGYVHDGMRTLTGEAAAMHALRLIDFTNDATIKTSLGGLAGHFALVVVNGPRALAVVDRIRSIPLFWGESESGPMIDDRATRLRGRLSLTYRDLDADQALAVAMSGYTVGTKSLYRGLNVLRAGEALFLDESGTRPIVWHAFRPWSAIRRDRTRQALSELHRFLIERLANSADGRCIAVPLSAGLDSRFIASGLKAIGYRHVQLFSYGCPGNAEAETARAIADRLGYPWSMVAFHRSEQYRAFRDEAHQRLIWEESDTCSSVPFQQDWLAIALLRKSGKIPQDAIIVNGQTGDFISGNHAPTLLMDSEHLQGTDERRQLLLSAYKKKHYRLWKSLATSSNDSRIGELLVKELQAGDVNCDVGQTLSAVHEMLEYHARQSKYVVSGQRTYEALGYAWRLPLWDDDYVDFWASVPAADKREQKLYRDTLLADNWGGVWNSIPVNAKGIFPRWIIPLRFAAMACFVGRRRQQWHNFERRYFGWFMDPLATSAIIPFGQWVSDRNGARHVVAWLTRLYLERHGVEFDELVARGIAKV